MKTVTNAEISAVMAELGRRGNLGRPKRMTRAERAQRRKAARASVLARRRAGRGVLAQSETTEKRGPKVLAQSDLT